LYFPTSRFDNTAEYTKIKTLTVNTFSYFDKNAVDCARLFVASINAEIFYFAGTKKLPEFITEISALQHQNVFETQNQNNSAGSAGFKPPKFKLKSTVNAGERNQYMHDVAVHFLIIHGNSEYTQKKYNDESQKCVPQLDYTELGKIYQSALKWYNAEVVTNPNYIRPNEFRGVSDTQNKMTEKNTENTANTVKQWQKPIPFGEIILPKFPTCSLPQTLTEYIETVSEFSETDPAMCGVLLLGVLGGVLHRKYEIVSTAGNTETLSLFSLIIAEPAERKSSVIKLVTKPLSTFESEYNISHQEEVSESRAERKILQKKLAEAEKSDDDNDIYSAQKNIDTFEEKQPISLMVDDTTPEALVCKMKSQGERIIVIASEGGFFKRIKGRYTPNNDDKNIYLKSHSGDRHSVDRIGRPSEILEKPAISIIMTVQKIIIDGFLADDEMQGTGMTARFLYAFCAEKAGNRKPTRSKTPEQFETIFEKYNKIIFEILNQTVTQSEIKLINLSESAFNTACSYFFAAENRTKDCTAGAKGWHGKSYGLMLKIAGILHAFECFEKGILPECERVSAENISRACELTDYLAANAEKAFSPHDKVNAEALYLLDKIKMTVPKNGESFTKTELLRLTHGRFKKAEDLLEPLSVLQDLGYITTDFLGTGGRPAERIIVNPMLKS
jgi:hypothetical protein